MDFSSPEFSLERTDPELLDPDEISRLIRRLAIESYRALNCSDASIDELTTLYRQVEALLQQTQQRRAAGIDRWLRNTMCLIDARLHPDPIADLPDGQPQFGRRMQTSKARLDYD